MAVTLDPDERAKVLDERGIDFADAELVFAGQICCGACGRLALAGRSA